VDQRALQGWHPDPSGQHEQRYFSGGQPTKLVRDGLAEAYDEPPPPEEWPDHVAVAAGVPSGGYEAGPDSHSTTPHPGAPARGRRTGLVNTVVALVAVGAVVGFVGIDGGFSPKHGPKPQTGSGSLTADLAAFVTASARSTLAQKTADVSLTATTEINGSLVYLRGNGQVDLAANTMAFNLRASYSGTTYSESEIMTGRALYVQVTMNGQSLTQALGGKHWMEIPLSGPAAQSNAPQDSPGWSLQLLEQQGAKVTTLGSRTVGGLTCSGYAVTPSQQAMLAAAQQEWSQLGLSSSVTAAARQMLENSTPPTIAVWLDPKRDLACELDVAMQLGTGTSAEAGNPPATESIQMVLTFTHYGVPVDITAPAQQDTVSF